MENKKVTKSPHTRRKNIISAGITILILLLALIAFRKMSSQKKSTLADTVVKKERRKVETKSFIAGEEKNLIEVDGRLQAHERVSITSKVQGIMQEGTRSIKVGHYFKKGDLLFSIDSRQAGYNLKAQKSSLLTAITQMMPDIKFDYPQSLDTWQNYLNNFDVEKSIQPLPVPSNDQEKYFIAGRNLQNQYYQIKSLETQLADYNIYAPFSGVVTAVNVYPGALISPGQQLANMINTAYYEIQAPIALENLNYVKVGQKVLLESTDIGKQWTGKVNRIGTQIDANTQNIPLYITVSGKGLKDGMYLKGKLEGNTLDNVVKLPKQIFLSPSTIYVVEDSTLTIKELEPIKRMDNYVLVKGVEKDDKVVTGSLAGLYEGQKVTY